MWTLLSLTGRFLLFLFEIKSAKISVDYNRKKNCILAQFIILHSRYYFIIFSYFSTLWISHKQCTNAPEFFHLIMSSFAYLSLIDRSHRTRSFSPLFPFFTSISPTFPLFHTHPLNAMKIRMKIMIIETTKMIIKKPKIKPRQ